MKERTLLIETIRNEAKIHKTLDSPTIVKFLSFHEIPRTPLHDKETKEEIEIHEAQRISHYILMEHA